jgi:hypothetical protein
MARYPRAVPPNRVLDSVNLFALDLGAPALADTDRIVVDRAQANAAFAIANAAPADGLARNVTVTSTQAGGTDDTPGIITVVGTNVAGTAISEVIIPVNGSTVAGTKAFKTITSVTQSGWTAGGTADRIEVGFGALVGFPSSIWRQPGAVTATTAYLLAILGGAIVAATYTYDADEIEKNTVDASAGTYNGTKRLSVLIAR